MQVVQKVSMLLLGLTLVFALAGCGDSGDGGHGEAGDHGHDHGDSAEQSEGSDNAGEVDSMLPPKDAAAHAILIPLSGESITGAADFVPTEDGGYTLKLEVTNAPPGDHAVHIHETGDCTAEDGSSAGGHWNPEGEEHGKWGTDAHHLGDIGNMTVDENGEGSISLTTTKWTVGDGSMTDILGKAIIVHTGKDDFSTQPTGAAGGRIACGVIVVPEA